MSSAAIVIITLRVNPWGTIQKCSRRQNNSFCFIISKKKDISCESSYAAEDSHEMSSLTFSKKKYSIVL